jgi:DNA-binding MarR family transcriptional regulator
VAQDEQGVRQLVQELDGMPLALSVAGSLLAAEATMGWGVRELLDELTEGTRLLQEAAPADRADLSGQTTPSVTALLRKSTDRLDALTRKQFAFLGVFAPKPATFDRAAIAAAWGVDDPRPAIRELEKRGLLEPYQEDGEVRFQMHALLTAHAKSMWEDSNHA